MHVVQLNLVPAPAELSPLDLLDAWPSLADIAEAAAGAGIRVSVIQSAAREARFERRGIVYRFLPLEGDVDARRLAGEVAGIYWQPVGGGNSVAICGLIGLFSVWQAAMPARGGPPPVIGAVVWGGIGLWLVTHEDIHGAALVAGFLVGFAAVMLQRRKVALA